MPLVKSRPLTPGQRFLIRNKADVAKKRPEKQLTVSKHEKKGRNCYGRITSRRRGGGHKKHYRLIDFRRDKIDIPAKVQAIEYDPNRSANIALLAYADGEKRYILAPRGVQAGDTLISSSKKIEFSVGYSFPLALIPPATKIHAVELHPGRGAQLVRSAGEAAQLIKVDGERVTIKLPSGEIRFLNARCRATIGEVGNHEHEGRSLGKAGRNRWLGRRPRVRGVAMNPVDHPMGGGEGRTSGGGHPQSPWGQLSKGFPTRKKSNPTNSQILVRRNGRPMKRK
ncbi:MAG: 50S ribosomal protein L2 [Puniceicoccaceae bacterium MED-G32]|jgi:large subunit ribosomal protein L2|nr:MAG: 50S ribosomal protein L2 [Puniceicoccaceae bacterium MED-G32]|tara:strand:+ start:2141 stop:2986 length:846 start_codon:yes stop_codon:yes gene_type:complete